MPSSCAGATEGAGAAADPGGGEAEGARQAAGVSRGEAEGDCSAASIGRGEAEGNGHVPGSRYLHVWSHPRRVVAACPPADCTSGWLPARPVLPAHCAGASSLPRTSSDTGGLTLGSAGSALGALWAGAGVLWVGTWHVPPHLLPRPAFPLMALQTPSLALSSHHLPNGLSQRGLQNPSSDNLRSVLADIFRNVMPDAGPHSQPAAPPPPVSMEGIPSPFPVPMPSWLASSSEASPMTPASQQPLSYQAQHSPAPAPAQATQSAQWQETVKGRPRLAPVSEISLLLGPFVSRALLLCPAVRCTLDALESRPAWCSGAVGFGPAPASLHALAPCTNLASLLALSPFTGRSRESTQEHVPRLRRRAL